MIAAYVAQRMRGAECGATKWIITNMLNIAPIM